MKIFLNSTLRVPVTRSGWKTVHFSCLDFGYIIASRKLWICEVQNPTYSETYSETHSEKIDICFDVSSMFRRQFNVSTSVQCFDVGSMWRHRKLHRKLHQCITRAIYWECLLRKKSLTVFSSINILCNNERT